MESASSRSIGIEIAKVPAATASRVRFNLACVHWLDNGSLSIDNRDRRSRALSKLKWSNRITLCTVTAWSALKGWYGKCLYLSLYNRVLVHTVAIEVILRYYFWKCQWILCKRCNYAWAIRITHYRELFVRNDYNTCLCLSFLIIKINNDNKCCWKINALKIFRYNLNNITAFSAKRSAI